MHAWRERLSREQVRQVEAACAPAMRLLAYPRSGEDGDVEPPEDEETELETEARGRGHSLPAWGGGPLMGGALQFSPGPPLRKTIPLP